MSDTSNLTDEEIVEKVRSGDRELYALLMDRFNGKLLRYASNLVRDEDKASHIVQDAFVKGYVNLNGFDTRKKFSSWIYRIVHNEAINIIKKFQREVSLPPDFDFESSEDIMKDYEREEISAQVVKCLESIPFMYSEPLNLYYIEEKSYQEISDILRIPIGTVSIRISRAKKLMKNICQKI